MTVSTVKFTNVLLPLQKNDAVWGLPRVAFVTLLGKLMKNTLNKLLIYEQYEEAMLLFHIDVVLFFSEFFDRSTCHWLNVFRGLST